MQRRQSDVVVGPLAPYRGVSTCELIPQEVEPPVHFTDEEIQYALSVHFRQLRLDWLHH